MPFWTPEVSWVNLRKSSEKLPKAVAQSRKGKVDPKLSVWASKYFIQTGQMPFWTPEVVWFNLRKSSEKLPKWKGESGPQIKCLGHKILHTNRSNAILDPPIRVVNLRKSSEKLPKTVAQSGNGKLTHN